MKSKTNVILLTIDSLRADCCGFVNKDAENLTPNLNALAKDCAVFENAFSVGPATAFSFPGILTSTYPLDFGKDPSLPQKEFIGPPRKLLSEVLKENGYETAAFHSNAVISEYFGYNRGWDFFECPPPPAQFLNPRFLLKEEMRLRDKIVPFSRSAMTAGQSFFYSFYPQIFLLAKYFFYRMRKKFPEWLSDSYINNLAADFISARSGRKSPFFFWIHYMDLHMPYYSSEEQPAGKVMGFQEFLGRYSVSNFQDHISKPAVRRLAERCLGATKNFYKERVRAADRRVGDLLEDLKRKGIYENALIIVTADHGDEFLEHGGLGHGYKLYNELLHVPLLIKFPRGRYEKITKFVSLIDIPTTVCDTAGIPRPKVYKGGNLFNDSREFVMHQVSDDGGRKIISACQNGKWKYILTMPAEQEELYNLKSDPAEKNNLASSEKAVAAKMRSRLKF